MPKLLVSLVFFGVELGRLRAKSLGALVRGYMQELDFAAGLHNNHGELAQLAHAHWHPRQIPARNHAGDP